MKHKLYNRFSLFLLSYLTLSLIVGLLSISYYRIDGEHQMRLVEKQEDASVALQQVIINSEMKSIISDLISLSNVPYPVGRQSAYSEDMLLVKQFFLRLIQQNSHYQSIKFIDLNGNPMTQGAISEFGVPVFNFISNVTLDTAVERQLFDKTINLSRSHLYISAISFLSFDKRTNRRPAAITQFATPVFTRAGLKSGVVVISIFMSDVFKQLSEVDVHGVGRHIFADAQGVVIVSQNKGENWRFNLAEGERTSIADRYPLSSDYILNNDKGQKLTTEGLISFVTLRPFEKNMSISSDSFDGRAKNTSEYIWKAVSFIPAASLEKLVHPNAKLYVLANVILLIVMAVISAVIAEISVKRIHIAQRLKEERQNFKAIADFTYDWETWKTPDGSYNYVSPSCERISGYCAEDFIEHPELFFQIIHSSDRPKVKSAIRASEQQREFVHVDFRILRRDGTERWISHTGKPVFNKEQQFLGWRASNSDITERKHFELQMSELAMHDQLTGLPNRKLLYEHCQHILAQAIRESHKVALLFIDLDNFKSVNDILGHAIGDEFLQQVANAMKDNIRAEDIVSRVGGDEFIAVFPRIDNLAVAKELANKLKMSINELAQSIDIEGEKVSASIGIALFPDQATTIEEMVIVADKNMYKAKRGGKNAVCTSGQ
ncbi:diguanylate cyclase [Vibrio nitrifigilis]|uniref:Diguanylate cyclase n=1 Tax=Vibrio nitrifigilis TaxID=2789781 RepID=A0ABS0GBB1_9VIBR|nr:diguanylate cyclase [Vibrio nitrifigilis]MBF8999700.1 diguanylate cyclase [Vibrio nitrifigilis]